MLGAAKSRRKAGTAGLGEIRGAEYPDALIGSWLVQTVCFLVLGWYAAALYLAPRMSPESALGRLSSLISLRQAQPVGVLERTAFHGAL